MTDPQGATVQQAFLRELAGVCRKHGLSLSHEDRHGAFEVVPFDPECEEWLLAAWDRTK